MRFDTEKKTPTTGRPSRRAAQNPKTETIPSQSVQARTKDHAWAGTTRTPVVPLPFFDERRNLKLRHPFGLEELQVFALVNIHQ